LAAKLILRLEQRPTIENLRNYPLEFVDQLERVLLEGVSAQEDPSRTNFYDIEHNDRTYFVHLSPSTEKVMLLAVWSVLEGVLLDRGEAAAARG
jgi:hypothetical protein